MDMFPLRPLSYDTAKQNRQKIILSRAEKREPGITFKIKKDKEG